MIRGPGTKVGGVGAAQVIAKIKATSTSITNGGSYSGRNRNLTLYPVCEVPQRCLSHQKTITFYCWNSLFFGES